MRVSIDPESFVLGEPVAAQLRFENTTGQPINFYHRSTDLVKHIVIENGNGQILEMEVSGAGRGSRMRKRESPIRKIAPEETFEANIEGKIIAASGQASFAAGRFYAACNLMVNDEMLAQIESAPTESVWTGKLISGTYAFSVTAPTPAECIDCHGDGDYNNKNN